MNSEQPQPPQEHRIYQTFESLGSLFDNLHTLTGEKKDKAYTSAAKLVTSRALEYLMDELDDFEINSFADNLHLCLMIQGNLLTYTDTMNTLLTKLELPTVSKDKNGLPGVIPTTRITKHGSEHIPYVVVTQEYVDTAFENPVEVIGLTVQLCSQMWIQLYDPKMVQEAADRLSEQYEIKFLRLLDLPDEALSERQRRLSEEFGFEPKYFHPVIVYNFPTEISVSPN